MSSTSPSPSRSRHRLGGSATQRPYPASSITLPDGQVDDETAELLHEFVHSHPHTPVDELPDPTIYEIGGPQVDKTAFETQRRERTARPWWRRPSATWFVVLSPLAMLAVSALIAPRLQLYTYLMCKELDSDPWNPENGGVMSSTRPVPCAADPVVLARVARLIAITATVQGILSCLTATFWGSFTDRNGRVPFLSLNFTALLLADAALAALAVAPDYVPGSYWFIVYVSAFEGLIGGPSAAISATRAYLADCSDPATRTRIFSRFHGLLFIGVALGPALGGLAERLYGNPYVVFYLALGLHAVNALFTWFIIPESLLPAQMDAARRIRRENGSNWFSKMFSFLSPLAVFAPRPQKDHVNPQETRKKKDWSLTWLALSFAPESLILGGLQFTLQYAVGKFGWTAEITGYYISLIGITRAFFLMIGLPAILRFCARRNPPIQLPTSPNESLDASPSRLPSAPSRNPGHVHTPAVDLGIAKVSLALQATFFALIALSRDARIFVTIGVLGALAMGYSPAIHSLSLEFYTRRGGVASEAGRLFGAMSVIEIMGSQVFGPTLFGIVYIKTVATFPEAIFLVVTVVAFLSLFFLFLVRIPPDRDAIIDAEAEPPVIVVDVSAPLIENE